MQGLTSVNRRIYQINTRVTLLLEINYPVSTISLKHTKLTTLQIRPIISSLEGPLYKTSWLLTQILKPLLPTFSGHVKNSDEVIHRLTQLNTEQLMHSAWM